MFYYIRLCNAIDALYFDSLVEDQVARVESVRLQGKLPLHLLSELLPEVRNLRNLVEAVSVSLH